MKTKALVFAICISVFLISCNGNGTNSNSEQPQDPAISRGDEHEVKFTDANFDDFTAEGVVLVDFWAPWCGPCVQQGPIVEQLAGAYHDKATVGKLNVDNNPQTADRFGVRSIPTLLFLKNGEEVKRFVGRQSYETLERELKALLE